MTGTTTIGKKNAWVRLKCVLSYSRQMFQSQGVADPLHPKQVREMYLSAVEGEALAPAPHSRQRC